jgi:hypothetical protein
MVRDFFSVTCAALREARPGKTAMYGVAFQNVYLDFLFAPLNPKRRRFIPGILWRTLGKRRGGFLPAEYHVDAGEKKFHPGARKFAHGLGQKTSIECHDLRDIGYGVSGQPG